jgi:hypothetical protein
MKLIVTIKMDNAAFDPSGTEEAARILKHVADVIERGNFGMQVGAIMPLGDLNGNRVGEAKVTR